MASDYIEDLRLRIIAEAQEANATIETVGKKILELAKVADVPIKIFANTVKDMAGLDSEFNKLIDDAARYATAIDRAAQAQEKLSQKSIEKVSQLQAVQQVDANDAAYAQRLANQEAERKLAEQRALAFGKEMEQVNKLDADLKQLDARLKNGTATIKEYSTALASMIKPSTITATQNIAPNLFNKDTVAQVKRTMAEIQAITKLEAGKVAAIMKTMFPNIDTRNIEAAKRSLQGIEPAANKAGKGLWSLKNMARTAFGTLTAMLIFKVGQAISSFFTTTLQAASQFRSEMAELNLAEAILSKKGMDITRQEFDGFIKDIETKSKYLSKLDATKVVAETAGAVQEFDVSKQQMKELADSIAFIQMKNKVLGREEADAAHIINAAMDARSNFFNGMGINITEALIKEKAYEMQLVKTGQELDKASRFQAVMALLIEQTAAKQEEFNKQLEGTPLGNQLALQKEWENASLRIGDAFITVKDNLVGILNSVSPELADNVVNFFVEAAHNANIFIDSLKGAVDAWKIIDATLKASQPTLYNINHGLMDLTNPFTILIVAVKALYSGLLGLAAIFATVGAAIITFIAEVGVLGVGRAFTDAGKNAAEAWKRGWEQEFKVWNPSTVDSANIHSSVPLPEWANGTPTGDNKPKTEDFTEPVEDIQGALDKMNNEILEAQIKLGQDMEEAALDWNRKLEDIAIEYAKKRADAELDYANKVRDIVSSYNDKIASINLQQAESNEKARNDELEREAKFQEQMRQLKEKFLMSLDDALHARDARQILRLIAQYNLDKAQAEREHALDKESAKRDQEEKNKQFARERADAERERNQKLEEARQEYQDKLLQLEINEKAEREAADLAYKRKMEDLDREMKDKLELVAAGLIQEFNLTRNGMDAILNLYKSYYSQISEIYAAMNRMLSGTQVAVPSTTRANGAPVSIGGGKRYAEGGIAIADRPTNAVFGERGLEMATFTPLNRAGRDVNTIFSSLSSSGEPSSTSTIQIMLSKDLEGRIVDNALNHTANIILSTMRE